MKSTIVRTNLSNSDFWVQGHTDLIIMYTLNIRLLLQLIVG